MRARPHLNKALALAALLSCSCAIETWPDWPIENRIHHGRYVHPQGLFSMRVPTITRNRPIAESLSEGAGRLTFLYQNSGTQIEWRDATLPEGRDTVIAHDFARPEAILADLKVDAPESEIVHRESIVVRGEPAEFFVLWVPGGPEGLSRSTWFRSRQIDVHLLFVRFDRDGTTFLVGEDRNAARVRTRPWYDDETDTRDLRDTVDEAREQILGTVDRIVFDDPIIDELGLRDG